MNDIVYEICNVYNVDESLVSNIVSDVALLEDLFGYLVANDLLALLLED